MILGTVFLIVGVSFYFGYFEGLKAARKNPDIIIKGTYDEFSR